MHALHCETLQTDSTLPHVYGVKRVCLLNSLKYFKTANNFAVDIMHDILEGVAQLEVKLVLQYIHHNFLSADGLAGRVHAFDYVYNQQRNCPPVVKLFDGSNDSGLNVIQSWCLLHSMPLLFGDLVERDDKYWHLLLLLLQIVKVVFSPVLTEGMTIYLKHLIIEHCQLFKKLFPERNLLAMYWESFSQYRLSLGPGKMVELKGELKGSQEMASKLGVAMSELVYSVKWIKHHGKEYHADFIICPDVACEMPVFCKINTIVMKDENVLLCGTLMETICFDDHYHAFTVRLYPDRVLKVVNVNELCYFKPFDLQKYGTTDFALRIVPYCQFMQT
ncbi:uncharacterized protein LOC113540088 [Pangasianodon hypophthalmus]|uniref:uncharacterized protein LOC113540088 n=1 Tax=Pangasianodon hypophthalmus TaxID=310915 RepID=UPI000EFDBDDC|nr:uncharacterized protein LOC113540088 [Pangasianodon hypophthalmus]XP_026792130.1 uncharacterized protein LOC113540088 [Pangasianodon hypophthalmus]XP_026792140.1 uncharacterized protein LOC113540088 [Pangasianodon hypophthalmus]XP_026792147.1 uncharacterized protein LOC113540088 [Pangasianodon hypophthalmus]